MGGGPWRKCYTPRALIKLPTVCITDLCGSILARVSVSLLNYIIRQGVCVYMREYTGSSIPDNITHSHITSTCLLHNWIKRGATVPENKKAVQLMRTRSGSERYGIVPVSISCLFFLWVAPKNTGWLLSIPCFEGTSVNNQNCRFSQDSKGVLGSGNFDEWFMRNWS